MAMQCRVSQLSKSFAGKQAVDNLDMSVDEGEILCVLGPSGCGKSTLLRLISGLERPDTGFISIEGTEVVSISDRVYVPTEDREVSLMFQNYALWPHMTIKQNLAYPLHIRKWSKAEIDEAVLKMLKTIRLEKAQGVYPSQLSGGEQQRVALGRALIANPRLLLLDEPFSNLDARLREDMQYELKRIVKDLGLTVIHVTHDQSEAMALADRIAVMNKGRIVEVADPKTLFENPKTLFAARFIGKSNLFSHQVCPEAYECLFEQADKTYVVRQDSIHLTEPEGMLQAQVISVGFEGTTQLCTLAFKDCEIKARVGSGSLISVGDTVGFELNHTLVF